MERTAIVNIVGARFRAELNDGRFLETPNLTELASELNRAGVSANRVSYAWRAGQRLLTAGQRVALCAALRCPADHFDAGSTAF